MNQNETNRQPTPPLPTSWTELTGATNAHGVIYSPGPKDWMDLTGEPAVIISPAEYSDALDAHLESLGLQGPGLVSPEELKAAELLLATQGIFPEDNWGK